MPTNPACEHRPGRRCCFQCCQHCWLLQQTQDDWDRSDDYTPRWLFDDPQVKLAYCVLHSYDDRGVPTTRSWEHALEPLGINEYGVHGFSWRSDEFVPLVCLGCDFLDWDSESEYGRTWHFCEKNLKLPIRQGYCRMRARHDPNYRLPVEAGTPSTPGPRRDGPNGAALPAQREPVAELAPPSAIIERLF